MIQHKRIDHQEIEQLWLYQCWPWSSHCYEEKTDHHRQWDDRIDSYVNVWSTLFCRRSINANESFLIHASSCCRSRTREASRWSRSSSLIYQHWTTKTWSVHRTTRHADIYPCRNPTYEFVYRNGHWWSSRQHRSRRDRDIWNQRA